MAHLPRYQYGPLKSHNYVRVLALQPAPSRADELKASIIQYDRTAMYIESQPVYEAMSYTWGDPLTSRYVVINKSTQLPITINVDTMLRYFRKVSKIRHLWVDAICLNQVDHEEKSIQVRRMGAIYQVARKVRIWLGEARKDSQRVLEFFSEVAGLEDIAQCVELVRQNTRLSPEYINDFFSRRWFSRRWILQEAVLNLSTTIHVGETSIHWDQLMEAVALLQTSCQTLLEDDLAPTFFKTLWSSAHSQETMSILSRLRSPQNDILSLLWDFHTSECRDPGDRIRALYGLANLGPRDLERLDFDTESHWSILFDRLAKDLMRDERVALTRDQRWLVLRHVFAFGSLSTQNFSVHPYTPDWSTARENQSYLQILANRRKPSDRPDDALLRRARYVEEVLLGQSLVIMTHQNVALDIGRTDVWKPFLKVVLGSAKLRADAIAARAIMIIADLLPAAGNIATESSDKTVLSISLEGGQYKSMDANYHVLNRWLIDGISKPEKLELVQTQIPWIRHCTDVLYNLFQHHSFFASYSMLAGRKSPPIYGFGPRNLAPGDIIVDSGAPQWRLGDISLCFSIREDMNPNNSNVGTQYRLVGSSYILGKQAYDAKMDQEFTLVLPLSKNTAMKRGNAVDKEEKQRSGLRSLARQIKDGLTLRPSSSKS